MTLLRLASAASSKVPARVRNRSCWEFERPPLNCECHQFFQCKSLRMDVNLDDARFTGGYDSTNV
jgi:hypothetical protein